MGFLKNMIKKGVSDGIAKGVRDAVGGAVEKAVNPVAEKWANKTAQDLDNAAGAVNSSAKETNDAFANLRKAAENYASAMEKVAKDIDYEANSSSSNREYYSDGMDATYKIRKVLSESFPQYQVIENVSPTTIGGSGKFMNYSFGVYSATGPKLFIMLVGKTTCSMRTYRWSKEQAARCGVTMINFVTHYPNNIEYIVDRLQKYL